MATVARSESEESWPDIDEINAQEEEKMAKTQARKQKITSPHDPNEEYVDFEAFSAAEPAAGLGE